MLKTFLGKFTFFFWLSFFLINIPIHVFGITYIKDLLKSSEQEKISLMVHTLKPVISLNISFNQFDELQAIFDNILKYKHINSIEILLKDGSHTYTSPSKNLSSEDSAIFYFQTQIVDPFEKKEIAVLTLGYENTYLNHLNQELLLLFFSMFFLAFIMFFLFFLFFVRQDFNALGNISKKLLYYLNQDTYEPIQAKNVSTEISTIVDVVNNVIKKNIHYVKVLKVFNTQLEDSVSQKVSELQKQGELMVHQSRQAAMGEMLESIAHQWRQPLNIIGLATTKLDLAYQFKEMDDATFHEVIETVSYNINYMSNTINDFRNFIHPNIEQIFFTPEKSFQELVKILGAQLENNSIKYTLSIEENTHIYGVGNEFQQVALIMINNSIDAIKSQVEKKIDRDFRIYVHFSKDEDNSIIQVSDNGGGIKESDIHSIFNAYFSTKFSSQGTGIGLHIVRNIIETRMHGSVTVHNIEDGCCFTIKLPLKIHNKDSNP